MISVNVRHERGIERDFDITAELDEAKSLALSDGARILREEQAGGRFPTDEDEYELRLRNRGRETRRDFATLHPRFLRIPFSLTWTELGGGTEAVRDAALYAVAILRRRTPFHRGDYLRSTSIRVAGRPVSVAAFRGMELRATDSVTVAPSVKYATVIEAGYARSYYQTEDTAALKGGVVRPIAAMVRARFGAEVNARFTYIQLGRGRAGRMPAVEIGTPGRFTQNDARRAR